jgi:predicted phosphoribosyltransferase
MMSDKRVLLIVDRTISDTRSVPASARALIEREATEVYVIAPVLTSRLEWVSGDDSTAVDDAEQRLRTTLEQLYAVDVVAAGTTGGDDAILTSIGDALVAFTADEIVIAVNVAHEQHWRERHLADAIRARYALPLTELVVDTAGLVTAGS